MRDARSAGDAGPTRGADHPRRRRRAARRRRAGALGRRGRGFRRPHARRDRGRRLRAAGARRRARILRPRRSRACRPSADPARPDAPRLSTRRRARSRSASFAPSCRPTASTIPAAVMAAARALAGDRTPMRRAGASIGADWRAAEALLRRRGGGRSRRCARSGPKRRLPISSPPIAPRSTPSRKATTPGSTRNGARRIGGEALRGLFDEWAEGARPGFRCSLADYAALFDAVVAGQRAPVGAQRASAPADSRPARSAAAGLRPRAARRPRRDDLAAGGRDRRLPQPPDARRPRPVAAGAAHRPDRARFRRRARRAATRSSAARKKRGGAPTVASRFLQRIAAVAGEAAIDAAEARGARYLAPRARARPARAHTAPTRRPEPRPPLRAAARRSSASPASRRCAATLTRSTPRRSSALTPLAPIGAATAPREIGDVWHAALQAFAETRRRRRPCPRTRATAPARPRASALRAAARRPRVSAPCAGRASCAGSTRSSPSTPSGARAPSASSSSKAARLEFRSPTDRPSRSTARADRIEILARRRRGADRLQDRRAAGRRARCRSASRRN